MNRTREAQLKVAQAELCLIDLVLCMLVPVEALESEVHEMPGAEVVCIPGQAYSFLRLIQNNEIYG